MLNLRKEWKQRVYEQHMSVQELRLGMFYVTALFIAHQDLEAETILIHHQCLPCQTFRVFTPSMLRKEQSTGHPAGRSHMRGTAQTRAELCCKICLSTEIRETPRKKPDDNIKEFRETGCEVERWAQTVSGSCRVRCFGIRDAAIWDPCYFDIFCTNPC